MQYCTFVSDDWRSAARGEVELNKGSLMVDQRVKTRQMQTTRKTTDSDFAPADGLFDRVQQFVAIALHHG